MRLNLLATTAIAVLASTAAWAQAPGAQTRDEKPGAQEHRGTQQQPGTKKEDRNAGAQAQSERRPEQSKSSAQHEEGQARGKAAQQEKNTPSASQAQSADKPDANARGADRKQSESRDSGSPARQNAASEKSTRDQNAASEKGTREKSTNKQGAANAPGKSGEGNNAQSKQGAANTQTEGGDANNAQSRQGAANAQDRHGETKNPQPKNADTAKPNEGLNKNAGADTKSGASTAATEGANRNAAQNQRDPNSAAGNKGSASTKISEADRTKIFSTLKSERQTSNQRLNIQVNVGQRLPQQARPRRLPDTIVRLAPEYRGYEYVMVQDEIAIVRPGTREVVDIIQEPGRSYARSETSGGRSIRLTDQQRQTLLREARPMTTSQASSSGSSCLSYQPVPDSLANENPDLRSYQFLAIGNEIVLVDPKEQKIVDVIRQ